MKDAIEELEYIIIIIQCSVEYNNTNDKVEENGMILCLN